MQGVARLVVPGDHVNLMLTTDQPTGAPAAGAAAGDGKETKYVLQNVEVLAVGNSTTLEPGEAAVKPEALQAGQAKTVDSGLMTFAVPALDAERVVHASEVGSIHLTLVPPDYAPAPVAPVNRGNLFS